VVDDELEALEDVDEGDLAVRTGEPVVRRHLAHRQSSAAGAHRVPLAGEFLFAGQEFDARGAPLLVGHDGR
jgi:hypothetical protein